MPINTRILHLKHKEQPRIIEYFFCYEQMKSIYNLEKLFRLSLNVRDISTVYIYTFFIFFSVKYMRIMFFAIKRITYTWIRL